MRNYLKAALLGTLFFALIVSPAQAHHNNWGDFGIFGDPGGFGFGGFGFGDHFGGFGRFGGFGSDFGFNSTDAIQTHFQDQYDSLMTKYNDGVANTTDFYTSSDYTKILDQTQLLSDRDNLFVIGVQDQIDRIPDLINLANDNLTYYNDLLSSYQSDTSISSSKLDRIQAWLNRAIDQVNSRIDSLNTQQSTLQTNLPTYQSFQTDVTTFLSDITTAGGGTSSGSTTGTSTNLVEALQSLPTSSVVMSRVTASCSTSMPVSSAAVPEPSAIMIVLMALGTVAAGRSCRPRRS